MQKPGCLANGGRLAVGFILSLMGMQLYTESGWLGMGAAFVYALFLALGARWVLLGFMGFARPLPRRKLTYGIAAAMAIALALVGVPVSRSYQQSNEPRAWAKVKDSKEPEVWHQLYENKVGEPFRRPDWRSRLCEVYCAKAVATDNFVMLRNQVENVHVRNPKAYDDQARRALSAAWAEMQQKGLAKVKPTKMADLRMSGAFKQLLADLADNPTRKVYLHFKAQGTLGKIPDDARFMANVDPKFRKLPVVAVEDAFSAEAHERRRGEVSGALQKCFDSIWPKGMLSIEPGNPPDPANHDAHLFIEAQVHRIPGFYTNTENNKIVSLLYKCEVAWKFRMVSGGKELGSFSFRSEPAKHVSYSTGESDPKSAPYSIVMDSAADNFARLIVGRMGLEPPPVREHYTYSN